MIPHLVFRTLLVHQANSHATSLFCSHAQLCLNVGWIARVRRKHKKLGHKIIVFSDRIFPLEVLSKALDSLDQKLPVGHPERLGAGRIDGSCEAWERQKLMDR
jgi:hypothetical protein